MTASARTAGVAGRARRVDKKLDPDPWGGPEPTPHRTVEVAPCEKNSFHNRPEKRICALEDCSELVTLRKRGGSPKRFCSERCQRIAERRRYRLRHWETAVCKGCGEPFERTTMTARRQVYCTLKCQADSRSREYRERGIRPPVPKASTRRLRVTFMRGAT